MERGRSERPCEIVWVNYEAVILGVAELDSSTYQGIKGAIPYDVTFVKLCSDNRILPHTTDTVEIYKQCIFLIARKRKQKMNDKQKSMNGDDSPTLPREKRVVPLLMVWVSHCGGRKRS